jgi:transposase
MRLKKWQLQDQVRQQGLDLLRAKVSIAEVARRLGVSRVTVYHWKDRGRGKGASIHPCGRKPKLTVPQRARLERLLERGAVNYGFTTEVWTGERIARVVATEFGVAYHPRFIPWLLRSWGWSWQKPGRQAIERNDGAITQWIRHEWPRVKKTPNGGMRA